jgi:tRNA (mo5U34)-methyltransferase
MSIPARPGEGTLQSFHEDPRSALEREMGALDPWFHNLHLPGGVQTAPTHPLGDFPRFKWEQIGPHLPSDLTGWTVLDIGCNAGFYSFALAARGATVDAIEIDPHYLRQGEWASRQLGMEDRVRFRQLPLYALGREDTTYDLVWFMGVFYHLRYPLLGLDLASRKARRLLVFQSLSLPGRGEEETPANLGFDDRARLAAPDWPHMAFTEHSFAGDPSNWWVPSAGAIPALLRAAGLRPLREVADETWLCAAQASPLPPPSDYAALFQPFPGA